MKLYIDPDVTPRQQPHRRIPFHVREDVKKELKRLEKLDIIETAGLVLSLLYPRNLEKLESVLTCVR